MKKIFTLSNLIPLLLVVYITKSFIAGPSFFDFGVILLMSISFNIKLKHDKDQYTDKKEILDKIKDLEEKYEKDFKEFGFVNDSRFNELEDKVSKNNIGVQFGRR